MIYSKDGLHLTEQFEGCKLKAYQDQAHVWTIGYGHTRGVSGEMTCTLEEAEDFLQEDLLFAEREVTHLVRVPLTQDEFDALVDFQFNTGALGKSTLLKQLNAGDYHGAAGEFERWDRVNGVEVAGLLRRRKAEKEDFTKGLDNGTS